MELNLLPFDFAQIMHILESNNIEMYLVNKNYRFLFFIFIYFFCSFVIEKKKKKIEFRKRN